MYLSSARLISFEIILVIICRTEHADMNIPLPNCYSSYAPAFLFFDMHKMRLLLSEQCMVIVQA